MEGFLTELADILEEDEVRPEMLLDEFEDWDSLSVLSVVAMVDSTFNVSISAQEIAAVETVAELWALVVSKRS